MNVPVLVVHGFGRLAGDLREESWMSEIEIVVLNRKVLGHGSLYFGLCGLVHGKVSGGEGVRVSLVQVDKGLALAV